jgi:phage FluMu protein Com
MSGSGTRRAGPGWRAMTNESIQAAPVVDREPRCWRCGKKLAELLTRPWRIRCVRCKEVNGSVRYNGEAGRAAANATE